MQVKHLRTQLVDLTGKLRESKMQTDALNDKLQNKDKLFRENLLERLTNSVQNVKIFLGLPGVVFFNGSVQHSEDKCLKNEVLDSTVPKPG